MSVYTRKTHDTRETLTVARAIEIGADPDGGAWVTQCEDHGTLANSATRALAMDTRGIDFCDGCRERQDAMRAATAQAVRDAAAGPACEDRLYRFGGELAELERVQRNLS